MGPLAGIALGSIPALLCMVFTVLAVWSLWSVLAKRRASTIALMIGACATAVGAFGITCVVAVGLQALGWIPVVVAFLPAILGLSTIVSWIAVSRRPKVRTARGAIGAVER